MLSAAPAPKQGAAPAGGGGRVVALRQQSSLPLLVDTSIPLQISFPHDPPLLACKRWDCEQLFDKLQTRLLIEHFTSSSWILQRCDHARHAPRYAAGGSASYWRCPGVRPAIFGGRTPSYLLPCSDASFHWPLLLRRASRSTIHHQLSPLPPPLPAASALHRSWPPPTRRCAAASRTAHSLLPGAPATSSRCEDEQFPAAGEQPLAAQSLRQHLSAAVPPSPVPLPLPAPPPVLQQQGIRSEVRRGPGVQPQCQPRRVLEVRGAAACPALPY